LDYVTGVIHILVYKMREICRIADKLLAFPAAHCSM